MTDRRATAKARIMLLYATCCPHGCRYSDECDDCLVTALEAHARDAVRTELESLREWVKQAYIDRAAVRDEITRRLGAVDSEMFDMDARLKALEDGE